MSRRMTVKEAAARWGVTERRVTDMCQRELIVGAFKEGGTWYIPDDAEKPADGRIRSGRYKKNNPTKKLPLPIGISDYRIASTQYYYVDKTMMRSKLALSSSLHFSDLSKISCLANSLPMTSFSFSRVSSHVPYLISLKVTKMTGYFPCSCRYCGYFQISLF